MIRYLLMLYRGLRQPSPQVVTPPPKPPTYGQDEHGRRLDWAGKPINPQMGEGRWQDALRRKAQAIADGIDLHAEDSTATGEKYTICSWGMCDESAEQWPDRDDHTWPDSFDEHQRVAPRSAPGGCPMDRRTGTADESRWGCFYHCRIFSKELKRDDRKRVLELYDEAIATRVVAHGCLTKDDDDEPWRNPS